ncbi:alpha/beta fold hydrolase [Psychrobacter phenylpyruvicus]|uniref:Short chain dehydrogenase n=1 Tax=Psychrobacter phenylpyruvicus TaxID=29432 RepID=A0A379LMF1_9GAMM|nr:alpha/beta hydrolase [Psychrobacter phenylpyruvicus]SUD91786.1 short chain dehydrogenase [Psychrobacter phenylpyruvicus]
MRPTVNSFAPRLSSTLKATKDKASTLLQPYTPRLQQLVSYDGVAIPITVVGNPEAEPVVLLHAFGMDARQFLPFVLPLLGQYCFYLPHFRGFGLAANTPSSEFNFIEQYADDVEVILSHICSKHQMDSVDVAAISMGALVVWAHFNRYTNSDHSFPKATSNNSKASATNHPSPNNHCKIKRYLNIDQSPIVHNQPDWQGGVFGDKQTQIFDQFRQVLQATIPYIEQQNITDFSHLPFTVKRQITQMEREFSLMSAGRLPSQLFIKSSSYLPDYKLAVYQHPTWQQKLHGLNAYLELPYDYRDALTATHTPVTMLIGAQSQLYDPAWQRQVADILPNAEVVEVTESGHAIPLDAPLQFAQALKHFLQAS